VMPTHLFSPGDIACAAATQPANSLTGQHALFIVRRRDTTAAVAADVVREAATCGLGQGDGSLGRPKHDTSRGNGASHRVGTSPPASRRAAGRLLCPITSFR
jgi:hypothetical protein